MINDEVDKFIAQYRDSLDRQKDLSNQYVANQRRNDFASIMSGANTSGMMYSNFPERSKIQYDTNNYQPALTKIQNTYRTGLDKLRSNTLNLYNQVANINEAIARLNKTGNGNGGNGNNTNTNGDTNGDADDGTKTWDYGNGYAIKGKKGGEATYYRNGVKISAGKFLEGIHQNPNWNNWNDIWSSGVSTKGVGSDTISAYNARTVDPDSDEYGYLYGR